MSTIPHYRDQGATLDAKVEIPEDAPTAQGHTEEQAADVLAAADEHKAAVEAETKAADDAIAAGEPVPGAPGDPTAEPEPEPRAAAKPAAKKD